MAPAATVGATSTSSDVYFAATTGVASLDSPRVNQTKLEIRTLVSEVANLAASDLELHAFLNEALPRICNAMGASAAALWSISRENEIKTLGHYRLPEALSGDRRVDAAHGPGDLASHQRILSCVAHEGSPVLVPPKSTRLSADRPTNPLDESLLIVPIKIFERHDTLLEIIQPHSGGPAAQRGYLRFVAQMADLVAEHLRRNQLRKLTQDASYVQGLREALAQAAAATSQPERLQLLAKAWTNLLQADLTFVLVPQSSWLPSYRSSRWQVTVISDTANFDARSQIVQAVQSLNSQLIRAGVTDQSPLIYPVADGASLQSPPHDAHHSPVADGASLQKPIEQSEFTRQVEHLTQQLNCDQLIHVAIDDRCHFLTAISGATDAQALQQKAEELAKAFAPWTSLPANANRPTSRERSTKQQLERWVVRLSTILLVVSLALFPVPDSLSTVAVLEAVDKQFYYAPSGATVERVLIEGQQTVKPGELMMELSDPQLQARLEDLEGQQLTTTVQLEQDRAAVLRGQPGGQKSEDDLRGRIEQANLRLTAIGKQLEVLRQQAQQLQIVARNDALITTWDSRNRLQGRPVAAGQLLLTTHSPNSPWQLKLSIPERQVGRIEHALAASTSGLNVNFSLNSHPGIVRSGRLISLSKQLLKDQEGHITVTGTVSVAAQELPTQTDGAVARASIDCGRTLALWLVVRDAYREATTWWRML